MLLLDVNVLVAAFRPGDPNHDRARRWWTGAVGDGATFATSAALWASFLRIVTSRRIFAEPDDLTGAFTFVDRVLAHPSHRLIEPGPRHFALLAAVCEEGDARGDLVPDAALAALALEWGCVVATFDRDFARFPSVRWTVPGRA